MRKLAIAPLTLLAVLVALPAATSAAAPDGDGERRVEKIIVRHVGEGAPDVEIDLEEMAAQLEWIGHEDGPFAAILHRHRADAGFLGILLTDLTPELRRHFGVPADEGVMVSRVIDDSAAAEAGILVGDILTRVDGEAVGSSRELAAAIADRDTGETVVLELWRDGGIETMSATLGEREPPTGERLHRAFRFHAEPGDGHHHRFHGVCPEGDCQIVKDCSGDGCECSVNGEPTDCAELGFGSEE